MSHWKKNIKDYISIIWIRWFIRWERKVDKKIDNLALILFSVNCKKKSFKRFSSQVQDVLLFSIFKCLWIDRTISNFVVNFTIISWFLNYFFFFEILCEVWIYWYFKPEFRITLRASKRSRFNATNITGVAWFTRIKRNTTNGRNQFKSDDYSKRTINKKSIDFKSSLFNNSHAARNTKLQLFRTTIV